MKQNYVNIINYYKYNYRSSQSNRAFYMCQIMKSLLKQKWHSTGNEQ